MKLCILEGVHAVGKSTLIGQLKRDIENRTGSHLKIEILEENYLEMENERFVYGTYYRECDRLLNWVENVFKHAKEGTDILVCDRGPESSRIYYGKCEELIDNIQRDIEIMPEIEVLNFIMACPDPEEHVRRIRERNGPFVEKELENLDVIKEKYKPLLESYTLVKNADELKDTLGL